MGHLTEGRKMFWSVMAIFVIYAFTYIVFEDYDRGIVPFGESSDWHLLAFSLEKSLTIFLEKCMMP